MFIHNKLRTYQIIAPSMDCEFIGKIKARSKHEAKRVFNHSMGLSSEDSDQLFGFSLLIIREVVRQ